MANDETTSELLNFIEKSGMARKVRVSSLQQAVLKNQYVVEKKLSDVSAWEWPHNLFARMHNALVIDDLDTIKECVIEWREWLNKIPPDVKEVLYRTLARVEAYIEDYDKVIEEVL